MGEIVSLFRFLIFRGHEMIQICNFPSMHLYRNAITYIDNIVNGKRVIPREFNQNSAGNSGDVALLQSNRRTNR